MGVGLGGSGVTCEGHNSQLTLPNTITTTTALFLPDSRARMRDRVQENKEKNKIEE